MAVHVMHELQALLDQYWAWLRDKTTLRQVNGWVEITTPYLDRHNDRTQIYARRRDGGYVLTDDGYILADLEQSAARIEGARRQSSLKMTINGFGVQVNGQALEVHASADNFALRKHNLVQAMCGPNWSPERAGGARRSHSRYPAAPPARSAWPCAGAVPAPPPRSSFE
jgi:hypothetical protein